MKKQLLILGAVFSTVLFYSQNKVIIKKKVGESLMISGRNNLLLGEDGTLRIEGSASLKVFTTALLTVKDGITNLGDGTNFTVQSDANLLQINNTSNNSGNLIAEREFKIGVERKQFNYAGSPVAFASGQSYKTIFPGSTNTTVLYHNQGTNTFLTSSGANIPGRGLAVKEPPLTTPLLLGKVTAQYKGVPQNGALVFQVANSNTSSTTLGYNLLGNPYPSNIDLIKLYALNGGNVQNNISATFYFWDNNANDIYVQQGSSYQGQAYAVYNALTGNSGTGTAAVGARNATAVGRKLPTNIVKVSQGFMTRSLKSTYGFLFDNTVRTGQAVAVDFLGKATAAQEDDRYWVTITAPSEITSTIAVVYYPSGNNLFGAEDSRSMGGSDSVYTIVEQEKLGIDGRSTFDNSDTVLLGSQHFVNGNYTMSLEGMEGIFNSGQNIYLKDNQTGIITDLSIGSYTFSANAGESTGRFEIIYKPETFLATHVAVKNEAVVYRDGADFVVKSFNKNITDLEIYEAGGKLVKMLKPNKKEVRLSADLFPNGIYLLKIWQGEMVTTKKIRK